MLRNRMVGTDLDVSALCIGGGGWISPDMVFRYLDAAYFEHDMNFIDLAEIYPSMLNSLNVAEKFTGLWIRKNNLKDKIVISTKFSGPNGFREGSPFSLDNLRSALEHSLAALRVDCIDFWQLHWPVRSTTNWRGMQYVHAPENDADSYATLIHNFDILQREGKVKHLGLSNDSPWGIMDAVRESERQNLPGAKINFIQNPFTIMSISETRSTFEVCMRENINYLAYSPLACGWLTTKYNGLGKNDPYPHGTRLNAYETFRNMADYNTVYRRDVAVNFRNDLVKVADDAGISITELSLRYCLSWNCVKSLLTAVSGTDQLKECVDAVNKGALPEDIMDAVYAVKEKNWSEVFFTTAPPTPGRSVRNMV
jgi:aryl-alcohol dehydrogenase-like predicted oxidoreductase